MANEICKKKKKNYFLKYRDNNSKLNELISDEVNIHINYLSSITVLLSLFLPSLSYPKGIVSGEGDKNKLERAKRKISQVMIMIWSRLLIRPQNQ